MSEELLRSFERFLPMSLLRAREAVMKKILLSLKKHNLSAQQWRVIRALDFQSGLELSELSKRCYLLMQSLSRIAQKLESRDLMRREAVVTDKRRSAIILMAAGHELFAKVALHSAERYGYIA